MKKINWKNLKIKGLAAIVYKKFKELKLDLILVGGACVTIYSKNKYQSYDLDYITYENMALITKALNDLGFKKSGKHFIHKQCPYYIEFVSPPVAIGTEYINKFNCLKTKLGEIKLLTPTDCVKDRLASFYFWNDWQALDQAIMVYKKENIDLREIKRWSKKEGSLDKDNEFIKKIKK